MESRRTGAMSPRNRNLFAYGAGRLWALAMVAVMSIPAADACPGEPQPSEIRELVTFEGWNVAERTQQTHARTVIFYQGKEVRVVPDSCRFDQAAAVPAPPGCESIYGLRRQGDILLALTGSLRDISGHAFPLRR